MMFRVETSPEFSTANMTYGQWWRMPANDTIFLGISPPVAKAINLDLEYEGPLLFVNIDAFVNIALWCA